MPTLREGPAASSRYGCEREERERERLLPQRVLHAPLPCSDHDRRQDEHDRQGGELHAGERRQAGGADEQELRAS